MNSATLRRLAQEHAELHEAEPPRYWLLAPPYSIADPYNLTRFPMFLVGPEGTPYAAGCWRVNFEIPSDYPNRPPKVRFRTQIYHPNICDLKGKVRVDILKRDWNPKSTIRDILIAISSLLIHPNSVSVVNAVASKQFQQDYQAFCRQAELVTSDQAQSPKPWRAEIKEAKIRSVEKPEMQTSSMNAPLRHKSLQARNLSVSTRATQNQDPETSDAECDEASDAKENDPSLSPKPVTVPSPNLRRPFLSKRPLSDLPTPLDTEADNNNNNDEPSAELSPSEQNIANNTPLLSSASPLVSDDPQGRAQPQKLVERGRSLKSTISKNVSGLAISAPSESEEYDAKQSPTKRACSDEEKERVNDTIAVNTRKSASVSPSKPTAGIRTGLRSAISNSKKASSANLPGNGSMKGKPRTGLRRL